MFIRRVLVKLVAAPLGLLVWSGSPASAQGDPVQADFVFLIDTSGSMSDEIQSVADGLSMFAAGLAQQNVDPRFAIVTFGTTPTLVLHFTPDAMLLEAGLRSLLLTGASETGLETIRMVLGASAVTLTDATGGNGRLDFRPSAIKNLILATDEDSDLPIFPENRQPGQSGSSACPLAAPWQAEVDATAQAVIRNAAFVNLLVEEASGNDQGVECQYGDFDADVADADLLNFDRTATLARLVANGFGASLEAQVLRAGLVGRAFDIARVSDPLFVQNFFAAKIEEVACAAAQLVVYGAGTPGKLGLPDLSFSALPHRGTQVEAIIVGATDVERPGCLLIGMEETRQRVFGFELLVRPTLEVPILVPAKDGIAPDEVRVRWNVPPTVDSCGMTYFVQAVMLDDAVGVSATHGMKLVIGDP